MPIQDSILNYDTREWTAFATNVPMMVIFMLLRVIYMVTIREPAALWDLDRRQGRGKYS